MATGEGEWTSVRRKSDKVKLLRRRQEASELVPPKELLLEEVSEQRDEESCSIQHLIGSPIVWGAGPVQPRLRPPVPVEQTHYGLTSSSRRPDSLLDQSSGHIASTLTPSPVMASEDVLDVHSQDWPSITPASVPPAPAASSAWTEAVKKPALPTNKIISDAQDQKKKSRNAKNSENEEQQSKKKQKKKKNKDNSSGGVVREPLLLELDTILQALELKQSKKVVVGAGAAAAAKQQQQHSQQHQREEQRRRGNVLDSSAPAMRRGKEREQPKKKRPTALRKVITREKTERRKELQQQDLSSIDLPHLDLASVDKSLEDSTPSDQFQQDLTSGNQFQQDITSAEQEGLTSVDQFQQDLTSIDQLQQNPAFIGQSHMSKSSLDQSQPDTHNMGQSEQELHHNYQSDCTVVSPTVCGSTTAPPSTFSLPISTAAVQTSATSTAAQAPPTIACSTAMAAPPTISSSSVTQEHLQNLTFSWSHKQGQLPRPAIPRPKQLHNRNFREYCDQLVTEDINSCVEGLLTSLMAFQDKQFLKDPAKAKTKRRYVCGLREVFKHLKLKRLKCVVIAPNLDRVQSEGGIYDYVDHILQLGKEQDIPIVFALTRRRLATLLHKKQKIACVGVFYYDGAETHYKELMRLVGVARDQYSTLQNGCQVPAETSDLSRTEEFPTNQHPVDTSSHSHCYDDPVLALLMAQSVPMSTVPTTGSKTCCSEQLVSASSTRSLGSDSAHISSIDTSTIPHEPTLNIEASEFKPRQLNIQAAEFIPSFSTST